MAVEEAAYGDAADARFRLTPEGLAQRLEGAGFARVRAETVELAEERRFPARALDAWFAPDAAFRAGLVAMGLGDEALRELERRYRAALQERTVPWRTTWVWIVALAGPG